MVDQTVQLGEQTLAALRALLNTAETTRHGALERGNADLVALEETHIIQIEGRIREQEERLAHITARFASDNGGGG